MSDIIHGFKPVFDSNSELLVLGSFPSVKSRAIDFYYGNRQPVLENAVRVFRGNAARGG